MCVNCPDGCTKCKPREASVNVASSRQGFICTECAAGLVLDSVYGTCYTPKTVVRCTDGMYYDGSTNLCQSCLANCNTCISASVCSKCKAGFALSPDRAACNAQKSCSPSQFYILEKNNCYNCSDYVPNCSVCKGTYLAK